MSKKLEFEGISLEIFYDPIEEFYYCGVPGYTIPTIYVEKLEILVEEFAKSAIYEYLDFCYDQGIAPKQKIDFDPTEAYTSGWIVRILDQNNEKKSSEDQLIDARKDVQIEHILSSISENHPNYNLILEMHKELQKLNEKIADAGAEKQYLRSFFINETKKMNLRHVKGNNIEVIKTDRMGIQKDSNN